MHRKLPQGKQVGKGSPVADAVYGGFLANRDLPLFQHTYARCHALVHVFLLPRIQDLTTFSVVASACARSGNWRQVPIQFLLLQAWLSRSCCASCGAGRRGFDSSNLL